MVIKIRKIRSIKSSSKDVKEFLSLLKNTIDDKNFNPDTDLFFNRKPENTQTMLDLSFDNSDIIETLLQLDLKNYSETVIDSDNNNPPYLYVFGVTFNNKEVYIKIKVRTVPNSMIICVSFHWAQHNISYPYV